MTTYNVPVTVSKQDDGLWRAEARSLPGCFVDAPTLAQAIADVQECIAMALDVHREHDRALPTDISTDAGPPFTVKLPVIVGEHGFRRGSVGRKPITKAPV